jgi:uncharacterized membrane protein YphA (DoxX/SURF4 family)
MKNYLKYTDIIAKAVASILMLQTLYFKFTASPESVNIFSTIGMEPIGRIGTGIGELIASILILFPRTTWIGSIGAIGLMSGAVFFHFTKLGIEIMNDKGQLFIYATLVLLCSLYLFIRNKHLPLALINKIK